MRDLLLALHFYFLSPILSILLIVLIVYVVMGWLIIFGIVQQHNPTARGIMNFLDSILRPLLRPIRKVVPMMGQLDLSVLILALIIIFLRDWAIPRVFMLIPF
ncbi:MAG TPA: YggT family protein [Hyphomonadaceae bacterium]